MSAEAPRNTGTGDPINPQRPESGLSRALRGFFGEQTHRAIQPPPELENFTDRLRQRVVDVTSELDIARRQVELDRINLARQDAERLAREKEAREKQERQFADDKLQALEEIKKIMARLKIRDRLGLINAHVWEGKGQIRDISTPPESATERFLPDSKDDDLSALQAGYELIYSYKVPIEERESARYGFNWRYTAGKESTSLRVYIGYADPDGTSMNGLWPHVGKGGKYVVVSSEYLKSKYIKRESYPWYGPEYEAEWLPLVGLEPLDMDGAEKELEQLLISESTERIRVGAIPSKLYLVGQERLKDATSNPQWKYVQTYFPESD